MVPLTLILLTLLSLLGGCAPLSAWTPPPVALPEHWSESAPVISADTRQDWWRSFDDPQLAALIDEVLRRNSDLALAARRAYRARLQAGLAEETLAPAFGANAEVNAARRLSAHDHTRTVRARASLSLSYELDLWRKLAHTRNAAAWEAQASEADRQAARLALIGTAVALYWQLAYLNQQITLGAANLTAAQKTLALVGARYAAGAASRLDMARAEQNLSSQRIAQSQLLQQRTEKRHAFARLFDRPPQSRIVERAHLPDTPLPEIGAGLPVDLLSRRPDLGAAELRLRASFAEIEASRASFYPKFTLTASLGASSEALLRVLQNPVAALGIGLTLPFLQWHTMQLRLKVSQTRYEEAVIDFRRKLYTALGEVEDALSARRRLIDQAKQREAALAQAKRIERLSQIRFRKGAVDARPWLEAQQNLRRAQQALQQNRLEQLHNQLKLYQALGGAPVS